MTNIRAVSRRRFLTLASLALPGALPARTAAVQTSRGAAVDPIVIVGAGLAGMRAADLLRRAGRRVLVLEARGRPGGRVLTIRTGFDAGLFGEAGPIRLTGAHQRVTQLAKQFGLRLTSFAPPHGDALLAIRGRIAPAEAIADRALGLTLKPDERGMSVAALQTKYAADVVPELSEPAIDRTAYTKWGRFDRLTFPAWLQSRGASADAAALMTLGGDSSQLSALYVLRQYAMGHGSTQRFKIQGGMDRLPRAMAASLGSAIRFNAPVVRVSRRGGAFRVDYRTDDGLDSVTASHVIFAVPFTTLRQIEIDPPLSREKSRMIDGLAYYPGVRFLLQSRTRFWQGAGQSGAARTDKATEVWHSTHDTLGRQKGILGASTGGIVGHRLAGMSQDDALREGVRLVADAFPRVDSEFERGVVVRWSEEPWSRGAFAAFGPGQMTAMMPAIARPEDGIHFAGEHTSAWTGWMEGALESGERAAREVLGLATEARGVREATVTGRK